MRVLLERVFRNWRETVESNLLHLRVGVPLGGGGPGGVPADGGGTGTAVVGGGRVVAGGSGAGEVTAGGGAGGTVAGAGTGATTVGVAVPVRDLIRPGALCATNSVNIPQRNPTRSSPQPIPIFFHGTLLGAAAGGTGGGSGAGGT